MATSPLMLLCIEVQKTYVFLVVKYGDPSEARSNWQFTYHYSISGWWFGTFLFSHVLGIIFRGCWNHQPGILCQYCNLSLLFHVLPLFPMTKHSPTASHDFPIYGWFSSYKTILKLILNQIYLKIHEKNNDTSTIENLYLFWARFTMIQCLTSLQPHVVLRNNVLQSSGERRLRFASEAGQAVRWVHDVDAKCMHTYAYSDTYVYTYI